MKIIACRPEPPGGFGNAIARVDVEISEDLRVFNLKLSRRPDGGYAVFAPNAMGGRVVTFSQPLVAEIARAALAALTEPLPHDRTT
ncbi:MULTISPECIES: hypothetical protein [unclassified Mesorhizobium]|uniref:hypothetical protein n=1 Tax=unclassified Mesorhizobium TaxID=325217 RepID=UPI0018DC7F36|nr:MULTISPECIES: hypothetical protein [unclassified Mesorhizobium]WJI79509.1 hypothetical protein NLY34_21930 [Mesorhizobium sp. C374B]WJI86044.1 hypothetical protein NLY42_24325 [Mesorhizobium sp. C372A]